MEHEINLLREEMVGVGKRMYDHGYVASNDGNISVRIDVNSVLITPTCISKGFMKPEDLIVVDTNGNLLDVREDLRRNHTCTFKFIKIALM